MNTGNKEATIDSARVISIVTLVLVLVVHFVHSVGAATSVVTSSNDSGEGTLRQAILDANATDGPDSILFNIPEELPITIQPFTVLPIIYDPVVLDATTQPGFVDAPVIELDGTYAVPGVHGAGLRIEGGASTIRGFVINRFPNEGIHIDQIGENIIEGNYIGTDVSGSVDMGNGQAGIGIQHSSHNTIGGTAPEARNVISGNLGGISLGYSAPHNRIIGNYIGTNAAGNVDLGNTRDGIWVGYSATNTTIGGAMEGAGNVIAGNDRYGIWIYAQSHHARICGNLIGTGADGITAIGNAVHGIKTSSPENLIGGHETGEGNVVAHNGGSGIVVLESSGTAILGNAVHSNVGMGIDLGNDGVTDNDTGDSDTGPNNLQNYPILTTVYSASGATSVQGVLSSSPNAAFTVQLFYSSEADPTGHGEGETYLGDISVTTDENGNCVFGQTFPSQIPFGASVSATATDEDSNTSEFGPCTFTVPVELVSFAARSEGRSVVLEWSTASEYESFGFHVDRSLVEQTDFIRITDQIIPAAGSTIEPQRYQFVDEDVIPGRHYSYRLIEISTQGEETVYGPRSVLVAPVEYSLQQNSPNPFSEATTIGLYAPEQTHVHLGIHDLSGRLVKTLHGGSIEPGMHSYVWDGLDDAGNRVAPGLYFSVVDGKGFRKIRKMVLMR